MKKYIAILISVLFLSGGLTSCVSVKSSSSVPPGQAKKITGSKSAKPFAPGQRKKK